MHIGTYISSFVLVAAVLGQSASAGPAQLSVRGVAPGGSSLLQIQLPYDPASLTDPQAVQALYDRIDQAATKICQPRQGTFRSLRIERKIASCHDKAVRKAVAILDAPLMTRHIAEAADEK